MLFVVHKLLMCTVHEANLEKHLVVFLGVRLTRYGVLALGTFHGAKQSVARDQQPSVCQPSPFPLPDRKQSNSTRLCCIFKLDTHNLLQHLSQTVTE